MNAIALDRKARIERCIRQTRRYYALESELTFEKDFIKQDAIAMNLQRAAELAIDIANHLIKTRKLGLPQDSKDSFALLQDAGMLESDLAARLKGMVGFRNILVHEYRELDLSIMIDVIENRLDDLLEFTNIAVKA